MMSQGRGAKRRARDGWASRAVDGETDRQEERHTETDRQPERWADRKANKKTGIKIEAYRDRQKQRKGDR